MQFWTTFLIAPAAGAFAVETVGLIINLKKNLIPLNIVVTSVCLLYYQNHY